MTTNLREKDKETFRVAFNYISRVMAVTYTTTNLHEIQIFSNRTSSKLPASYMRLFASDSLGKLRALFCDINKDEAIEKLIDDCFTKGIQPNSYIFGGVLGVSKIKHQETVYEAEEDYRYAG